MKASTVIALAISALSLGSLAASAQTYVLESKVALAATVTTQGTTVTTTGPKGTQVDRLKVDVKPFTNKEVLSAMQARGLIGNSTSGWTLVYLSDNNAAGGIYASKSGVLPAPVAVPSDLITLPAFGQSLKTGTETKGANGSTFVGNTEVALATATVHGQAVAGLATNGVRTATLTVRGVPYQVDTVSTAISFTGGGTGANGTEIIRGTLGIGSAKVSTLTALP